MQKKKTVWFRLANVSLKVKLSLILLLSLSVVFFSTRLTAQLPYAAYDAELSDRSVQLLTLIADGLQKEMQRFGDVTFQMLGDNVLQQNLSTLHRVPVGSGAWVEARREVQNRVQNFAYYDDTILAIQLLSAGGTHFTGIRRDASVAPGLLPKIYQKALEKGGSEIWLPDPDAENVLICARDVREVNELSMASLGVIVVRVDFARIVEQCSASLQWPISLAIYEEGVCIYATEDMGEQPLPEEAGYTHGTLHGEEFLFVSYTARSAGWQFVTALPYTNITSAVAHANGLALGLSLAAVAGALILGSTLMASLLRHIEMLLTKYSDFSSGHFPLPGAAEDPYAGRTDEIGRLHTQFGEMARAYNQMIDDNYVKQQLLLEAQFHQLRVQVRPHFLFNVLESIYCLAQMGGDRRIATMAEGLSKMLRSSLNDKRDIVTLEEDVAVAQDYLAIQTLRYGERLAADFDIPEDLRKTPIPNMTVQPLVENAVHHAAEEMLEDCRIHVYARRTEEGVSVMVENNGTAMDEEILEKLESGQVKPQGLGIGLRNIHQRLQLAFSPAYGLRIQSGEGRTRVIVDVPFEKEEGSDDQANLGG